jgi:hypothetical protein
VKSNRVHVDKVESGTAEQYGYAMLPDRSRQELIFIKKWDFNWQGDYRYTKPISLPKGTKLVMHYTYDNSDQPSAIEPDAEASHLRTVDRRIALWFQLLTLTLAT